MRSGGPLDSRMWWITLLGAAVACVLWLRLLQPAIAQRGRLPEALAWLLGTMSAPADVRVTFELNADSASVGAVMLREPGYRGVPVTAAVDLGALTPVSGVVLLMPPALRPASERDGARLATMSLLQGGRELGRRHSRYDSLGAAVRMRPTLRLPAGDYDVRVTLASLAEHEPPVVVFYRLRVR